MVRFYKTANTIYLNTDNAVFLWAVNDFLEGLSGSVNTGVSEGFQGQNLFVGALRFSVLRQESLKCITSINISVAQINQLV